MTIKVKQFISLLIASGAREKQLEILIPWFESQLNRRILKVFMPFIYNSNAYPPLTNNLVQFCNEQVGQFSNKELEQIIKYLKGWARKLQENLAWAFPIIKNIFPSTISSQLISVQPMTNPVSSTNCFIVYPPKKATKNASKRKSNISYLLSLIVATGGNDKTIEHIIYRTQETLRETIYHHKKEYYIRFSPAETDLDGNLGEFVIQYINENFVVSEIEDFISELFKLEKNYE